MKTKWNKTDKHVFITIWQEHNAEMVTLSTYTSFGHDGFSEHPMAITEWGFKNSDEPIIKSEIHNMGTDEETCNYFIASYQYEDDDK